MIIYMNGRFLEEKQASISVYDHGFMYGMGLFETMRTYNGVPFLWERHLERLRGDCRRLSIAWTANSGELLEAVRELLFRNRLTDAYLRLSVSAGSRDIGLPELPYEEPNLILYIKKLPAEARSLEAASRHLQRLKLCRNTPESGRRMKSFHYMNNILAKRELVGYAWAAGAEGLFLDARGYVAEGMVTNLFFVHHETIYTPHLDTGILPGITRQLIMELVEQQGWRMEEGYYTWEQLQRADEIFLTNSVQGIVPVVCLWDTDGQDTRIGTGKPGKITRGLFEQYQTVVREFCQHV
ncbi:aminodeoxychorismate lyase [Paenibacillus senegalensis]|uniref:aminodeoxychorismate lyase n=1 Tax=Paenibacillus senegalensis TaxID=1465766 RepID=UPI000289F43F|nr:aminodeoxychorismate lyase [Paenibacillus senegalensis]